MTIASRTAEGLPNRCPVCGNALVIEPSTPPGDVPCPNCAPLLLWFQNHLADRFVLARDHITLNANLRENGADSLDLAELMMEMQDEFNFRISDEEAEQIETVGDAMRVIEK